MKKLLIFLAVVTLATSFAYAQAPAGTKTNLAPHNFTSNPCKACHMPHNPTGSKTVLWRLTLPGATEEYALFGGDPAIADLTGEAALAADPDNLHSLTCLGCHDAAMATANETVIAGISTGFTFSTAPFAIADSSAAAIGNLTDDHPVMKTITAGTGFTIPGDADGTKGISYGGTVQCGSCHDPHFNPTVGDDFLRNTTSALCTACHN